MARHGQLIEQLKAVLDGSITETAVIEQIAIQCAEFLNGIHLRITQGLDLARRGLRMELRSLVDAKPPLLLVLDQFSDSKTAAAQIDDFKIDSDEGKSIVLNQPTYTLVEIWRKYCRENNLAIPPLLNVENIIEVRAAVSLAYNDRFDQLHCLFRRQNLALASVSMRLDTLRLLAKRDRKNPIWHEEIIRFENELIQELRHSLSISIQKGLLSEAEHIMQDLSNGEWRGVAEVQLAVAQCEVQVNAAWAEHAVEHASRLAQQMFANYMAESIDQVRESLVQWQMFLDRMERGDTEVPSEPLSIVTPIIEWLNLRDAEIELTRQTKERLEALERVTVDPTTSAIDVQACLIAAESILAEVPPALREIAEWRIRAHLAQIKTRRRMKVFAIILLIAVSLGFAVWFMMDQIRASRERIFIVALEAAVDRNDGTQIKKLMSDSSLTEEGFDQHPSSLAAMKRHADLIAKQAEADKNFEDLFSQAGDPTAISANRSTIEASANIARTDDQRERVKQWRSVQNAVEARVDEERNDAFLVDVRKFGSEIDQLELLQPGDADTSEKLRQAERFAERIAAIGNISQDAKVAFEIQRGRMQLFRIEVDQAIVAEQLKISEEMQLEKIKVAMTSPQKLPELFRQFASDFPGSTYSGDFSEVARNAEQWQAIAEWLDLRKPFMQNPIPTTELDRMNRRLELQKFRSNHPKSAIDDSIHRYEELLIDNSAWIEWLHNTLRTWTPMAMQELLLKNGTRYFYDPTDPPLVTGNQSKIYSVWSNWKEGEKKSEVIQRADIKSDGPSPQELLKNRLEELLTGRDAKISIETAFKIIRTIRDSKDVDPVARATLIDGLIPKVQSSAPYLKEPIEKAIQLLAAANLDSIQWTAPGIPSSRKDFKRMTELLQLDIPVNDWIQLQKDQESAVSIWLRSDLRPVGMIDQNNPNQHIRIGADVRLRPKEFLYIVTNSSTILPIGTVDLSGSPLIDAHVRIIPSGTPVFAGIDRPVTMTGGKKK